MPDIIMIRERVDIRGRSRPMESKGEISALKLRPAQVGLIKEAPTIRWLKGQEEWDKAYKRSAEKAIKKRQTIEAKAKRLIDNARDQGLVLTADGPMHNIQRRGPNGPVGSTDGTIQEDRRWGPLDLDDERPPPTAIAKRRDTVCIRMFQDSMSRSNFLLYCSRKHSRCLRRAFIILLPLHIRQCRG